MFISKFRPHVFMEEDDGTGTGQPPDPDGQADAETGDAKAPDWLERELKKVRAEAAKYRTDNKALAEKAARLDELEGSTKSDLEKLTERASTADQRAAEAEARALRLEVAFDKGLSPKQAARLQGTTKEELQADADDLIEAFGAAKRTGNGRMAENLRPSGAGEELPEETDPRKLAALHPRR